MRVRPVGRSTVARANYEPYSSSNWLKLSTWAELEEKEVFDVKFATPGSRFIEVLYVILKPTE